mgnify:CR=1 FL=1
MSTKKEPYILGSNKLNATLSFSLNIKTEFAYSTSGAILFYLITETVSFVNKDYASWKEADVARRRFMQDKKINVYYCPLIPSLSCITHLQFSDIMIIVSAVVAFSAGSLILTLLAFYYLP